MLCWGLSGWRLLVFSGPLVAGTNVSGWKLDGFIVRNGTTEVRALPGCFWGNSWRGLGGQNPHPCPEKRVVECLASSCAARMGYSTHAPRGLMRRVRSLLLGTSTFDGVGGGLFD